MEDQGPNEAKHGLGSALHRGQELETRFHVELSGLELLVPSDDMDASVASFDSYARDSVLSFHMPGLAHCQAMAAPLHNVVGALRVPHNTESSFSDSSISPFGSSDDSDDSSDCCSYANDSLAPETRKASSFFAPSSYRMSSLRRRGSLGIYAMGSAQMRDNLPRRFSSFSDYANDSFALAAERRERQALRSFKESPLGDALADKKDLPLDTTYNFSTVVYETQEIHGGAGRAA